MEDCGNFKTRITSLYNRANLIGHFCEEGIEIKCSFSLFFRSIGQRAVLDIL